MTDLGTINYTNENRGTVREDRSAELNAVGQGLATTKTVIDEGVKASVANDMIDLIKEAEAKSTTIEPERPVYEPGSPGEYLAQRIDRLNAIIEQGRTSQRTLAENQIKGLLASAQAKYPWLYDDLRARANAVVSGSQELAQIGLDDDIRTAQAKAAQGQFDAMMKHAHDNLHIDPALSPLDPQFIKEYVDAQERWDTTQRSAAIGGALIAQGVDTFLNDPIMYNQLQEAVFGARGAIQSRYWYITQEFGWDKIRAEVGKGEKGNQAAIQQWLDGGSAEQMLAALIEDREQYKDTMDMLLPPEIAKDQRGEFLLKKRQDGEEQYDDYIKTLTDAINKIPGAAERLDAMMSMRSVGVFQQMSEPHKQIMSFIQSPYGAKLLELAAEAKNPEGIVLLDRMSIVGQSALAASLPVEVGGHGANAVTSASGAALAQAANSTSALNIPPSADYKGVLDAINARLTDGENSWVLPVRGVEQELLASLRSQEINMWFWDKAKGVVSLGDPAFADDTLLGVTYSMEFNNKLQGMPNNVKQQQLQFLADGSLLQAVERSLEGGPSAKRNAFGHSASTFYTNSNPMDARTEAYNKFHNENLGAGLSLNDVIKLDMDKISNGTFSYTIDQTELAPLAQSLGVTAAGDRVDSQRGAQLATDLVNSRMSEIMVVMEQQIATERLINKAKSIDGKIFQMPDKWEDFFFGNGSPDPGSAWANVFIER